MNKAKVKLKTNSMPTVGFRLPEDITNWLRERARIEQRTPAQVVRMILRKEMETTK